MEFIFNYAVEILIGILMILFVVYLIARTKRRKADLDASILAASTTPEKDIVDPDPDAELQRFDDFTFNVSKKGKNTQYRMKKKFRSPKTSRGWNDYDYYDEFDNLIMDTDFMYIMFNFVFSATYVDDVSVFDVPEQYVIEDPTVEDLEREFHTDNIPTENREEVTEDLVSTDIAEEVKEDVYIEPVIEETKVEYVEPVIEETKIQYAAEPSYSEPDYSDSSSDSGDSGGSDDD